MTIKTYILQRIDAWKADRVRRIPDSYFTGYRRLALRAEQIERGQCWCCKHAVAHRSWWCDKLHVEKTVCSWSPCYVKGEISKADYQAGEKEAIWLKLPSKESV